MMGKVRASKIQVGSVSQLTVRFSPINTTAHVGVGMDSNRLAKVERIPVRPRARSITVPVERAFSFNGGSKFFTGLVGGTKQGEAGSR